MVTYRLFRATDSRDGANTLWLHRQPEGSSVISVAVFDGKTAPSRVKQKSMALPGSIGWATDYPWNQFANKEMAELIDVWEVPE